MKSKLIHYNYDKPQYHWLKGTEKKDYSLKTKYQTYKPEETDEFDNGGYYQPLTASGDEKYYKNAGPKKELTIEPYKTVEEWKVQPCSPSIQGKYARLKKGYSFWLADFNYGYDTHGEFIDKAKNYQYIGNPFGNKMEYFLRKPGEYYNSNDFLVSSPNSNWISVDTSIPVIHFNDARWPEDPGQIVELHNTLAYPGLDYRLNQWYDDYISYVPNNFDVYIAYKGSYILYTIPKENITATPWPNQSYRHTTKYIIDVPELNFHFEIYDDKDGNIYTNQEAIVYFDYLPENLGFHIKKKKSKCYYRQCQIDITSPRTPRIKYDIAFPVGVPQNQNWTKRAYYNSCLITYAGDFLPLLLSDFAMTDRAKSDRWENTFLWNSMGFIITETPKGIDEDWIYPPGMVQFDSELKVIRDWREAFDILDVPNEPVYRIYYKEEYNPLTRKSTMLHRRGTYAYYDNKFLFSGDISGTQRTIIETLVDGHNPFGNRNNLSATYRHEHSYRYEDQRVDPDDPSKLFMGHHGCILPANGFDLIKDTSGEVSLEKYTKDIYIRNIKPITKTNPHKVKAASQVILNGIDNSWDIDKCKRECSRRGVYFNDQCEFVKNSTQFIIRDSEPEYVQLRIKIAPDVSSWGSNIAKRSLTRTVKPKIYIEERYTNHYQDLEIELFNIEFYEVPTDGYYKDFDKYDAGELYTTWPVDGLYSTIVNNIGNKIYYDKNNAIYQYGDKYCDYHGIINNNPVGYDLIYNLERKIYHQVKPEKVCDNFWPLLLNENLNLPYTVFRELPDGNDYLYYDPIDGTFNNEFISELKEYDIRKENKDREYLIYISQTCHYNLFNPHDEYYFWKKIKNNFTGKYEKQIIVPQFKTDPIKYIYASIPGKEVICIDFNHNKIPVKPGYYYPAWFIRNKGLKYKPNDYSNITEPFWTFDNKGYITIITNEDWFPNVPYNWDEIDPGNGYKSYRVGWISSMDLAIDWLIWDFDASEEDYYTKVGEKNSNFQPMGIPGRGWYYDFPCLAMDFTGLDGFAVYFKASVNDHIERPEVVDYEIVDYKIEDEHCTQPPSLHHPGTSDWQIVNDWGKKTSLAFEGYAPIEVWGQEHGFTDKGLTMRIHKYSKINLPAHDCYIKTVVDTNKPYEVIINENPNYTPPEEDGYFIEEKGTLYEPPGAYTIEGDLLIGNVSYDKVINNSQSLDFKTIASASISAKINAPVEETNKLVGKNFIYAVDYGDNKWRYMGLFNIEDAVLEDAYTSSITGHDFLNRLNVYIDDFIDNTQYPITLKDLYYNLLTYCGINYKEQNFINEGLILQDNFKAVKTTATQILQYITELAGGFVHIGPDLIAHLDYYKNNNITIRPENYSKITYNGYNAGQINQIKLAYNDDKTVITTTPADNPNIYYLLDNALIVYSISEEKGLEVINNILDYVKTLPKYRPATLEMFMAPYNVDIQPGDIIRIGTPDNMYFNMYIMEVHIDSSGISYSSYGEKTVPVDGSQFNSQIIYLKDLRQEIDDIKNATVDGEDTGTDTALLRTIRANKVRSENNEKAIEGLNKTVADNSKAIEDLQETVADNAQKVEDYNLGYNTRFGNIEQGLAATNEKIDSTNERVDGIDSTIDNIESTIGGYKVSKNGSLASITLDKTVNNIVLTDYVANMPKVSVSENMINFIAGSNGFGIDPVANRMYIKLGDNIYYFTITPEI